MTPPSRDILLVEDDPDDVMLMQTALKSAGGLIKLQIARDGLEAMAYLRGDDRFSGAPRPALVLLDWRLPGKSGEQVLREIRADASLRLLPVLVLTTSAADVDVRTAYALGANAFLTKPTGIESLRRLVSLIEEFWLVFATLPVHTEGAVGKSSYSVEGMV